MRGAFLIADVIRLLVCPPNWFIVRLRVNRAGRSRRLTTWMSTRNRTAWYGLFDDGVCSLASFAVVADHAKKLASKQEGQLASYECEEGAMVSNVDSHAQSKDASSR